MAVTLGLPFIIITVANFLYKFDIYREKLLRLAEEFIHSSTHTYLNYVFSFWFLTLLLDIVKCFVGRLRPNFIEMCQPNTMEVCKMDKNAYVSFTVCLENWKKARNSRMSFPSGHAGASVFALLFVFYFLYHLHATTKNPSRWALFFRYFVSLFYLVFTIYCCYSRVTDFWHFPTDVLAGSIFALIIFALCFLKKRWIKIFN